MFFDLSTQMKLTQSFFDIASANANLAGTVMTSALGQTAEACSEVVSPSGAEKPSPKTRSKRSATKAPAQPASKPAEVDFFTPWLRMFEPQAAAPAVPANPMFATPWISQASVLPAWGSCMGPLANPQLFGWPVSQPADPMAHLGQFFPWLQPEPQPANPATQVFDAMTAMTKAAWPAQTGAAANPLALQFPDVMTPFLAKAAAPQANAMVPTLLTLSATCLSMALPLIMAELQRMMALPAKQLQMFPGPAGFLQHAA